jgi:Angiomotin C terminal.
MKPVELEIIMRDGTREGMQSASGNVDALSTMISDQKKLIVTLEQELNNLQTKLSQATNVGASNNDIDSVNNLKVKIKELEESLIELEKAKEKRE